MKRRDLAVILGTTLLFVMGVASLAPAMPRLQAALGLSSIQVTLLMAAFALPGFFLAPFFGAALDRIGRKRVLVPTLVAYGIAGCLVALTSDFRVLFALRLAQGIGNAPLGTIAITLIGDRCSAGGDRAESDRMRASYLGLNSATLSFGTALWPAIGGALGGMDWHFPFLLAALAFPLALAAGLILERDRKADPGAGLGRYAKQAWAGISDPRMIGLYAAALGCFFLLYGSFLTNVPIYLSSRFGMKPAGIGALISFMSIPTIVVAAGTRALLKRWSSRALLLAAFVLYSASLAILPLMPSAAFLLIPTAMFGVAQALAIPNILILLNRHAPPAQRAMIMSVYSMFMHLGQALAPVLVGVSVTALGGKGVFFASAIGGTMFCALSSILVAKDPAR